MDQDKNTFSEGIEPGGLRTAPEIKLLICYLLKALHQPLSRSQINEIMQEYPIANYFEVNQALSELVRSGTLRLMLGHLSEQNNTPEIALRTSAAELARAGMKLNSDFTLDVAPGYPTVKSVIF